MMNPEQAQAVLEMLVEEGKIEQELLDEAIKKCPTPEMKRCADILHKLLCRENHDEGECDYYNEDQMEGCWTYETHTQWLDTARNTMNQIDVTNENQLKSAIGAVNAAMTKASQTHGAIELLLLTLSS